MIVIFKNEEGTFSCRPAFIGFIKNNIARRTLGLLFYPLMILITIGINIIQALFVCLFVLLRAFWYPLSNLRSFHKTELWKIPRTKADKNSKMD